MVAEWKLHGGLRLVDLEGDHMLVNDLELVIEWRDLIRVGDGLLVLRVWLCEVYLLLALACSS